MRLKSLRPLLALALASTAFGQAVVSNLTTGYSQSFDTLVSSGSGTWADNTTLAGWYARTTNTAAFTTYTVNTGSVGTTFGLYSFGSTSASDRAFGVVSTNTGTGASGTGQNFLGLRLTNSSGTDAISFSLAYDGEQWRKENNAAAQTLVVQYSLNATSVNDTGATWTSVSALTFTSPIVGATTAVVLDGNLTANRASLSTTVTATWLSNSDLWIRWIDLNDSGNDHILAVDNVSLTATAASVIPEPSTYAAIFGALALVGVALRRRQRA
jgi:hypothetical protein